MRSQETREKQSYYYIIIMGKVPVPMELTFLVLGRLGNGAFNQ